MSRIVLRGLTRDFGRVRAVDDLTVDVRAGQVTAFLGPNGAGKTTTFRMLLGLIRPTAGEALIDGLRYERLPEPRRVVGAVLEATGFHPGRTGRDHLRIAGRAADLPWRRVEEMLDLVELTASADRRVADYSLGMRQRLGLAAALLADPAILILDEPANGLDPAGIAWLRALVRGLAAEGRTVLISSHLLSEVAQTVDRVIIVNAGRLRFAGSLTELGERTVSIRAVDLERLRSAIAARGYVVDPTAVSALTVRGATAEEIGRVAAEAGVALTELSESGASLEEAFLRLTSPGDGSIAPAARPAAATIR
ncbi:MAG TPA: ATP-binding cassette domain-containing protein [Thermomicrobiaceae bacterium]|nr:ATP-binding cassette domain-containing protein [Thermomicrobiaceae bacterium]